jgi:hypothetical protein
MPPDGGTTVSEVKCPNCNAVLPAHEIAGGWCESCGKRIPASVLAAQNGETSGARSRDLQKEILTQHSNLTHCLLCQENTAAKIYYLRLSSVEIQYRTKITRWMDIRGRCCQRCSRKIIFLNRTMGIRVWLNILLMAGLFVGYLCLIPWLLDIGIPGAIVGFGTLAAPLVAVYLWRRMASHRWQRLLSPQTIELFKASGIHWDASLMSGLSITSEPVPGSSYLDMA